MRVAAIGGIVSREPSFARLIVTVVFGVGSRAALVWADGHIERFWAVRI